MISMLLNALKQMIELFYTPTDGLTVFGILALMGIAVGLVYFVINFVRKMFKA